jgi:hypothetical protein
LIHVELRPEASGALGRDLRSEASGNRDRQRAVIRPRSQGGTRPTYSTFPTSSNAVAARM